MFGELTWSTRLLFISLCLGTLFINDYERAPSPFEIWFYDDYLILFRDRHYYTGGVTRREYDKFLYKDIKEIQYRTQTKRVNIYGIVEGTWYDYNKDWTIPTEPTYHKTTDSIAYFYTDFLNNDIVNVIESHCPIKVTVDNT
ncbi:MAG: hypothetical protein IJ593_06240 [Lachnospiraceae bacterium]|nr:hypothetical protein [Lachnospiraceae bacterium]